MVALTMAVHAGQLVRAIEINRCLFPVYHALFCETNPSPIKAALSHHKHIAGCHLRLPLVEVGSANQQKIAATIDKAKRGLQELGVA